MDNYIGCKFGDRYLIKEVIGVGGMAVVYKAYDEIDDKTVAVKILKDEFLANEDFRRRFKNESKAIAILSHPNIVKVYDVNFGEKLQYIVMEYIEGITLKEYIETKKVIEWTEAVHFSMQILKALQHAHDKGIIHRDIKPQNIMLLQDGTIKVTDFGIARFNRGDTRTITENGAIGSVHYISPEQARGDFTDEKSDIYSVGVVMYEMLTGQLPFQSDSAVSVAIMQMQKAAEMPRRINPSIPVGLEQITMRAMQKSPRDRYQSAAEMLLDLEEFKRNPNIKFDYEYFIDKQPTKYVPPISDSVINASRNTVSDTADDEPDDSDNDYYEDETPKKKNVTMPILIAVIAVLVIGIGFTCYHFFFKNKNSLIVPDFTGLLIDEVDSKYPEFSKYIEKNPVYTSEHEAGKVFNQSIKKGTDLSKQSNKVIKLDYADNASMQQIPAFTAETTLEAYQTQLKLLNFNVKLEPKVTTDYKLGQIISTLPEVGSYQQPGSVITVIYAADDTTVAVPDLVGSVLSDAQNDLKAIGFKNEKIKIEYETVTDATLINHVIRQSIEQSTFIDPETSDITIWVGKAQEQKQAQCSFLLPDLSSYNDSAPRKVTVYDTDSNVITESSVKLDGSSFSFTVTGNGNMEYYAMIDSQKVCTITVDFTKNTPEVNVESFGFSYTPQTQKPAAEVILPAVAGLTQDEACDAILSAGFPSCEIIKMSSTTVPEGYAISADTQSFKTEFTKEEAKNERVILYVSKGPEG